MQERSALRRTRSRVFPALGLAFLLLALFVASFPRRLYGDDVWFVHCIVRGQPFTQHFLYLPIARAVSGILAHLGIDPFHALRLMAAGGSALCAALVFSCAARASLGGMLGVCVALLASLAPSAFFFATAAEVHGLHLAAFGLLAWFVLGLRAGATPRRVFAIGLAFGLLVGTHKSGSLMLPGLVVIYFLLTSHRSPRERGRDALAFLAAGLLALAAQTCCEWLETGAWFPEDDFAKRFASGVARRLGSWFGWEEFATYLSVDWVAHAFAPVVAGAAAFGSALRRGSRVALAVFVLLAPYGLFFPLFGYPELGAYYVITLPVLAALLARELAREPKVLVPPSYLAGRVALLVACLGGLLRPDELTSWIGPLGPLAIALAAFALGLTTGLPSLGRRRATHFLALLLCMEFVGAARHLAHFDRDEHPLDWARSVCELSAGKEAWVVTTGFQEYYLLTLLGEPWPEPWAGTWAFQASVPAPGPKVFLYGDPNAPAEEVERVLTDSLERGVPVYVDRRVPIFLEQIGEAGRIEKSREVYDALRARYDLVPVDAGAFQGERVQARL